MTDFAWEGFLDGHEVAGRVRGGRITGNPFVVLRVRALVDEKAHIGLGPWAGEATLDDDILARATVAAVLEQPRFDPEVPPEESMDPVPDGLAE